MHTRTLTTPLLASWPTSQPEMSQTTLVSHRRDSSRPPHSGSDGAARGCGCSAPPLQSVVGGDGGLEMQSVEALMSRMISEMQSQVQARVDRSHARLEEKIDRLTKIVMAQPAAPASKWKFPWSM